MKEHKDKKEKCKLVLDWASHKAAKYACENWHYSRSIPLGKLIKVGVWENDIFIGVIIYSMGTAKSRGIMFGFDPMETVELTRVALTHHQSQVSKILAISMKFLKQKSPGINLIISFADLRQGHHGGIYQTTNWIYTGQMKPTIEVYYKGKWVHPRSVRTSLCGFDGRIEDNLKVRNIIEKLPKRKTEPKYRFIYHFDNSKRIELQSKYGRKYPKRASSIDSDAFGYQSKEGGATPTDALQPKK